MNYLFSPSELDYKAKKCQRCFYILKKYKINPGDKPPPVFSNFDVVQKNYFKNLNSKDLTEQLPDGKFMNKDNLPGLIISDILEDNDGRKFQLRGVPDIVIKSDNYKYQLEAYAQIFKKPGATKTASTPKLSPITHMGVLQFFPEKIFKHQISNCDLKMQMSYSPLKRNEEDFFKHITNLINFLEQEKAPDFNSNCNYCKFVQGQFNL
jgi:hypothetical protein